MPYALFLSKALAVVAAAQSVIEADKSGIHTQSALVTQEAVRDILVQIQQLGYERVLASGEEFVNYVDESFTHLVKIRKSLA